MARNRNKQDATPALAPTGSVNAEQENGEVPIPLVADVATKGIVGPPKPRLDGGEPMQAPAHPGVVRYKVLNGGPVMSHGNRVTLHPGKLVDERNYDIASLRTQGITFQEMDAPVGAAEEEVPAAVELGGDDASTRVTTPDTKE